MSIDAGHSAPAEKFGRSLSRLLSSSATTKQIKLKKGAILYRECEAANSVLYLVEGSVKLTVQNGNGKEAVLAILAEGDFAGEDCLTGRSIRTRRITAIAPTTVLEIQKNEMRRLLHSKSDMSDRFIQVMLKRNKRTEADLIDQLFNLCEKRLARALLLLARQEAGDRTFGFIPKISQGTLASMIGTTRARVNGFIKKFKTLGYIQMDGAVRVNISLLTLVLENG